jgi:transposase
MRRRPLLERRFGVAWRLALTCHPISPGAVDEGFGRRQPTFQVERAYQRLDGIAQHIAAVDRAVVASLLAEAEVRRDADTSADFGAGLARDDRVESSGKSR